MAESACHDVFVSYAEANREWVNGFLLPALAQAGIRHHSKEAFSVGKPYILEFEKAVQTSRRILLVLSRAYQVDGFSWFTDLLAQSYGAETATWPVIPLLIEPVDLPPRLSMLTHLSATQPENQEAVIRQLCKELQYSAPGPTPKPTCPYPGMRPFQESDKDYFFGRNHEIQNLVEGHLYQNPFLAVIGPSGSGKSSLVFAGLLHALRQSSLFGSDEWLIRSMRPGANPIVALENSLQTDDLANPSDAVAKILSSQPKASRLLLIVDQFEEAFTISGQTSTAFQEALLHLSEIPNCYLILIVRADFYPDLMSSPLWRKIQAHRLEVIPLDEQGLREAIIKPAENVDVFIETALVERLVRDAAGEPGILPLLQETLRLLWERLERRYLPLRAYEAFILPHKAYAASSTTRLTGLQAAIARRADNALADLSAEQQTIARRIFLRLVQFGEGRPDTRRQQSIDNLHDSNDQPDNLNQVLAHLASQRLLTLSHEDREDQRKVDLAHEAIITGWPTLQSWIQEQREAEQKRRKLEEKVTEWIERGRGNGGLLDKEELNETQYWLTRFETTGLGISRDLKSLIRQSQIALKKVRRKNLISKITISGLAASILFVGGIAWTRQQESERDQLTRDAVLNVVTPELVQRLSRRLPDYMKVADRAAESGQIDRALADYQFIMSLKRLERDIESANSPENFSDLAKERKEIREIAIEAENSLATLIYQHRLPELENLLKKGDFGGISKLENTSSEIEGEYAGISALEDQYTGALKTTYKILMREYGAKADLNNDGMLLDGEEELLPCKTLQDIEELWRKFTEKKCGWYGSTSPYEEAKCSELNNQTLLSQLVFPSSIYLVENRLSQQCKVVETPVSIN